MLLRDRVAALDGVRAVAITGVFGVHAHEALPGGHLGVSVFFVLSGYLITTLLLAEHDRTGGLDLRRFYLRRSVRLMPALVVVLVAFGVLGYLIGRHEGLLSGGAAALLYSSNILMAYGDVDAAGDFAWGWTLSLEEQFYLAWPFGLALALRAGRIRILAVVTGALVATSCLLRVVLPIGDVQESTRVYAGIDTRMSGLLIGCLLALLLHHRPAVATGWARVTQAPALLAIGAGFLLARSGVRATYAGWILVVEVATAVLIAGLVADPWGKVSRALGSPLASHIGRISYGLYLWNIPAYWLAHSTLDHSALEGTVPTAAIALVWLGLSLAFAQASFVLVEGPARRAFERSRRTPRHREPARISRRRGPGLDPSASVRRPHHPEDDGRGDRQDCVVMPPRTE